MRSKINNILKEIEKKKVELKKEYISLMDKYGFTFKWWKIVFNLETKKLHKTFKKSIWDTLFSARIREVLSVPFIWIMLFPALILDLMISIYMHVCFRLYKIPLVKRKDYIVFDRGLLNYLNFIQKVNCIYCSYMNWLFSYAVEIWWRTERYWCPIKHAKKAEWWHEWEKYFADYWDSKWFREVFNKNENTYKNN